MVALRRSVTVCDRGLVDPSASRVVDWPFDAARARVHAALARSPGDVGAIWRIPGAGHCHLPYCGRFGDLWNCAIPGAGGRGGAEANIRLARTRNHLDGDPAADRHGAVRIHGAHDGLD